MGRSHWGPVNWFYLILYNLIRGIPTIINSLFPGTTHMPSRTVVLVCAPYLDTT